MRKIDKKLNLQKVNLLNEQRYLQSKGFLFENECEDDSDLTPQENDILNDILSENEGATEGVNEGVNEGVSNATEGINEGVTEGINEGATEGVSNKIQKYAQKGLLTMSLIVALLASGNLSAQEQQQVIKLTPQEKRVEVERLAQIKRDRIIHMKDSIIARNAAAKGMSVEDFKVWSIKNNKKSDVGLSGLETDKANKRGEDKGSCSTGQVSKGQSLKDTK